MKSKYKLFGGGGLYLLILIWFITVGFIELASQSKSTFISLTPAICLIIQPAIIYYLASINLKRIVFSEKGILFKNPVFGFINKSWAWDNVDYFFTVGEQYRFGTFEAVWIIKDGKLIGRFTEFYYSNYGEMKEQLPIPYYGEKNLNTIQQLLIRAGLKKTH